jgi:Leucine-rich repeat (LRR) protein
LELVECRQIHPTDLKASAGLPDLESLNLRRSPIDDSALNSLEKLTKLRSLDLSETEGALNGRRQLSKALPQCRILGAAVAP